MTKAPNPSKYNTKELSTKGGKLKKLLKLIEEKRLHNAIKCE
jgi:hypothetical protein